MRAVRFVALLCLLLLIPSIQGYSAGIAGSTIDSGCVCHGGGTSSQDISATVEGVPVNWTSSETYTIYVNLTGPESEGINSGGFNLRASIGTLSIIDDSVQILENQATHTEIGNDLRAWVLKWTAPSYSDQNVKFELFANAVNGDGIANNMDNWNSASASISGLEQPTRVNDRGIFSTEGIIAIGIGIGIALIFILTTEAARIELEEE